MSTALLQMRQQANHTRYQPGQTAGHYESFFLRANHPSRPLAFWIRYTIFSPDRHPENAIGELWAVGFNGETQQHVAVKQEIPLVQCNFKTQEFYVQVGDACLQPGRLKGSAISAGHSISWIVTFRGDEVDLTHYKNIQYENLPKIASRLLDLARANRSRLQL